jgi:hypothetical protein
MNLLRYGIASKKFFERVLVQCSNLAPKGANLTDLILESSGSGKDFLERGFRSVSAWCSNLTGLIH